MKRAIIVANWKMHKTQLEAKAFLEEMAKMDLPSTKEVWIAPSYTSISILEEMRKNLNLSILIGAQNVNEHNLGAFTGEISAAQLSDAGAKFVIIGHSERRHIYLESDAMIEKKIAQALNESMIPLLCVGETEDQRAQGVTKKILSFQIRGALGSFSKEDLQSLVVAYEPVWAIGTGKIATPEIAEEAHQMIKKDLANMFGEEFTETVPVLYGGSVKAESMQNLMKQRNINGVLVGGASLAPDTFQKIINY